jgi:hypothetical protein
LYEDRLDAGRQIREADAYRYIGINQVSGVLNEIRAALQTCYPRQSSMKYKNLIDARRDGTPRHI